MLFTSFTFWAFFLVVTLGYWSLNHRLRGYWLLLANYTFYGWWDWRFLFLLASATLVAYFCGIRLERARSSPKVMRFWLLSGISFLLGVLFFFKYCGWFVDSAVELAKFIGLGEYSWSVTIALPIGISFYTFQLLTYLLDVYRDNLKARTDLLYFSLFVSFFPQLVAGPIERNDRLQPQLESKTKKLTGEKFREGFYLIIHGLFLKIVVADNLSAIATEVYTRPVSELSFPDVLIGTYAFAFQVYGDFAGYSSIARGIAKMLGIDLMVNFRNPYLAVGPSDFWRRWHISLSSALRDYIFIPLSMKGSRLSLTVRNLLITMLIGGIWHGANWTFVAWGLFHGVWLALEALVRHFHRTAGRTSEAPWWLTPLKIAGTFHMVCISYVFFRAESIGHAFSMLATAFQKWEWNHFSTFALCFLGFFGIPLMAYEIWLDRRRDLLALTRAFWPWRVLGYLIMIGFLLFFAAPNKNEFIYFRF